MKKKLVIGLSIAGIAALAIGNSLAYLSDEKTNVNVMTVGKVNIEQLEYERVVENGSWVSTGEEDKYGYIPDKLQEFTQAKPISPAVYKDKEIKWDDRVPGHQQSWDEVGAPGSNQLFDDSIRNVVDKFVFVKNTGAKDAYYRTIIAIEVPEGISDNAIHTSLNANERFDYDTTTDGVQTASKGNNFFIKIDGVRYLVYTATYTEILKPGEVSRPSLLQVFLDPTATNEDVELFGEVFEILAISQAVQTDGFDSANEALESAFGVINKATASALFNNSYVIVKDGESEKLTNALKEGKAIYVENDVDAIEVLSENGVTNIDAKGATVVMNGEGAGNYGYLAFAASKNGEPANVENLTVTGNGFIELGHYGLTGGVYTATNLNIRNVRGTVGVSDGNNKVAPAFVQYGTAVLNDCVMTGAKGETNGYTQYDAGFVNKTNTIINGGEYGKIYLWSQSHVTINNAKVGTIDSSAITSSNLGMLTIGAGTTVDTINITASDKYTPALTIEEGATVGTINYKGVSYSQEQWLELNK